MLNCQPKTGSASKEERTLLKGIHCHPDRMADGFDFQLFMNLSIYDSDLGECQPASSAKISIFAKLCANYVIFYT
jgi:hypothetical protein